MPELPEVESVRRSVAPLISGHTVRDARLFRRDIAVAPGDPAGGFSRQRRGVALRPKRITPADLLVGATILRVERRGKQIAIIAQPAETASTPPIALGVQLGMTGGLQFVRAGAPEPADHVHARWILDHGSLLFRDPRRFGGLRIFRSLAALDAHWSLLGPDALDIAEADLRGALSGSRRAVKAALLDQAALAGVGNIYADEALFIARINPSRIAAAIRPDEVARLAAAIRAVLGSAVLAGGSTLTAFVDAEGRRGSYQDAHAVYGRAGEPCPACSHPLSSAILAQRTTVWCSRCQPRRSPAAQRIG